MKKITTKYLGEMEIEESALLHFDEGMWGFEDTHTYALVSFDEEEEGLLCLQSDEDPSLAFVVINPFSLVPGYTPVLDKTDEMALGLEEDTPVSFLAVVVVKEDLEQSTANLRCPIVVNMETRAAKQVVLQGEYPLRCSLAEQMKGA